MHTCLLVEDRLFFALSPSGNVKRTHTPQSAGSMSNISLCDDTDAPKGVLWNVNLSFL